LLHAFLFQQQAVNGRDHDLAMSRSFADNMRGLTVWNAG